MSRWFRAYDDALNNPKIQRLPPALFKTWFNLLCVASKYGGTLPPTDELAYLLRRRPEDVLRDVAALRQRCLLDEVDGQLVPHDWDSLQFKSDVSTQRVREHRKRSAKHERNVSGNASVTPPETEQNREEKKDGADAPLLLVDPKPPPSDDADLFARGKKILGPSAGGLVAKLKKAKGGSIPLARAALEVAATKHNPAEYIGRIISAKTALTPEGEPYPDGII